MSILKWFLIVNSFPNYNVGTLLVINIKLAKREQKRKEQRVAYVYLVRISQSVSLEISLRQYYSVKIKNAFKEMPRDISKPSFPYEFCVVIAEVLKNEPDAIETIKTFYSFFEMAERIFDQTYNNFKIPDDLLAQFHRDAIVYYDRFIGNIFGVNTAIGQWLYWAKTGDTKLIRDETLYAHYLSLKVLVETLHKFYDVLKTKAGISNKKADELLKKQKEEADRIFKETLFAGAFMDKIYEIYFKKPVEKMQPDESKKLIEK